MRPWSHPPDMHRAPGRRRSALVPCSVRSRARCGTSTSRASSGSPNPGRRSCARTTSRSSTRCSSCPRPAQHQLRRQGRVHGLVEDQAPLPGPRHDPDRPLRRREGADRARRRRRRAAAGRAVRDLPEGTRSRDGKLYKGRTAQLAWPSRWDARSIPSASSARPRSSPRGPGRRDRSSRARSRSAADPPERYAGRSEPHLAWRSMIDEVMFEIAR